MPNYTELLSLLASLVSAAGALFAVRAAYRAADSAREAHLALAASDRRTALRELSTVAGSVLVEAQRVNALVGQVILLHRSMAMASGISQSEQLDLYVSEAEKKRVQVGHFIDAAIPYAESARGLLRASAEEVDSIQLQQTLALKTIQALREDLDHEHTSIEGDRMRLLEQMEKSRLASRY